MLDPVSGGEGGGEQQLHTKTKILKFYTVNTPTLDVFRGELSFPQDKPVEQWPEP